MMPLTKKEFKELCDYIDNLKEFGHNEKGYVLIEYASVREILDKFVRDE